MKRKRVNMWLPTHCFLAWQVVDPWNTPKATAVRKLYGHCGHPFTSFPSFLSLKLKLQDGALKKARLQCCNVSMCTRATTHGAVAPTPAQAPGWGDCISFTSASQPAETFRLCRHRLRPDVGALLGGTKREAN